MDALGEMLPVIGRGFLVTLPLLGWSLVVATVLGTLLAACRVSPVPPLRALGTAYVNIFRNTPLVVIFLLVAVGLPELFPIRNFELRAIIALSVYTAAFVCEAVRSGINTVNPGQAEAARAVGMTFLQTLGAVVLPQALRAVIPPLASVYIALAKNTSVAAAFGVVEATFTLSGLIEDYPQYVYLAFAGIAAGYVLIVLVISALAAVAERSLAVAR